MLPRKEEARVEKASAQSVKGDIPWRWLVGPSAVAHSVKRCEGGEYNARDVLFGDCGELANQQVVK